MAFTSTVTKRGKIPGTSMIHFGTYASDGGSTGGDINTGLTRCEFIALTPAGASVDANAPTVNETLPVAGDAVTVVTTANATGTWMAIGF